MTTIARLERTVIESSLERSSTTFGAISRREQRATLETSGMRCLVQQARNEDELIDITGPIEVYRGDTAIFRITVTDDTDEPIDLTGATIEFEVKPALGSSDPATIHKALGDGITLAMQTGDTLGKGDIRCESADTDITPGLYWADVVTVIDGVRQHALAPREFMILDVVNRP